MTLPMISVVMSVFNGERFLSEAVESILAQSFSDFEFIVIDDGSTDGSAMILESYQRIDSRMRVYRQEKRGLVASLNRGCGLARGKYIARMDADDVAVKDRLAQQVGYMESNPEVGLLGGAVQMIDAAGKPLRVVRYPLENYELQRALLQSNVFWHPTVLIRTQNFKSAGGYRNIPAAEDYDLWLRMAARYPVANLRSVLLNYRIHSNQVSARKCRQQALGAVAAQRAATLRKEGKQDPLGSVDEITSAVLDELGVGEANVQTTLAWAYLSRVQNMLAAGEYSPAVDALQVVCCSDFEQLEKSVVAESRLLAARAYWHRHKFAKSLLSAGYAVATRPILLGRPLKPLLQRFRRVLRKISKSEGGQVARSDRQAAAFDRPLSNLSEVARHD